MFSAGLLVVPLLLLAIGTATVPGRAGTEKAGARLSARLAGRDGLQLVGFAEASQSRTFGQLASLRLSRPPTPSAPVAAGTAPPTATTLPAGPLRRIPVATTPSKGPPTTTTTTTTVPPAPVVSATGQATWYQYAGQPANECASPWLPFGTVLHVTDVATGASTTCVVEDREADRNRVVDLAPTAFEQIAPLSRGVVIVTATW